MLLRTDHRHFDQEIMRAKFIFNFHVTLSLANDKKIKVVANNYAEVTHSQEALSLDCYRCDTQVLQCNMTREHKKIVSYDNKSRDYTSHLLSYLA
jgi:hypothetical protein